MGGARRSDPVGSLENSGPGQAKAGLRTDQTRPAPDPFGPTFGATMKDAVIAHYGSVKEAAYALGQVDPSLLMRELGDGKFGRFDKHADEGAKAAVVGVLNEAFGKLSTPKEAALDAVRGARKHLDTIAQALEHF